MSLSEFEIIGRFFAGRGVERDDVVLGIGDDAALLTPMPGRALCVAVDTIVEQIHFPAGMAAADIGYRALAVNLSDLAAMGAEPQWFTLALTMPCAEEDWLGEFANGLFAAAETGGVALVGGDTTRGPLSVSVQVLGSVTANSALRRSSGGAGDLLFVTGAPGEAAAGLQANPAEGEPQTRLNLRFRRPVPRVGEGMALRRVASAAIDVSDGLLADAARLAQASGLGVRLDLDRLPLSADLRALHSEEAARDFVLYGGDDYELLFSVPDAHLERLSAVSGQWDCACTRIGRLVETPGVTGRSAGTEVELAPGGYTHF